MKFIYQLRARITHFFYRNIQVEVDKASPSTFSIYLTQYGETHVLRGIPIKYCEVIITTLEEENKPIKITLNSGGALSESIVIPKHFRGELHTKLKEIKNYNTEITIDVL